LLKKESLCFDFEGRILFYEIFPLEYESSCEFFMVDREQLVLLIDKESPSVKLAVLLHDFLTGEEVLKFWSHFQESRI
jgi:hypothetical protein